MADTVQSEADETRRLLAESVAGFIAAHPGPARVRRLRETKPGIDRAVWNAMAEAGWFGLRLPEAMGGASLGVAELAVVMEGLGSSLAPEPVGPSIVLAGGVLTRLPPSDERYALLRAMMSGETIPALAWQEQANAYDPVEVRTTVTAGRLSGRKCFVVPAATADGFLVTAGGANGLALHWIPANAEGVSISLDASVDGGFVGTVTFDRAAATLLADGPDVSPIIDAALDEACLAAAAELVGVMSAALDMTLAYTRQRVQFGVAIGSFQALQHRLVDLWMQAQLSRAALRRAIAAFDAEPLARALAVTAAKARASDAALLIARQGIQLHGGMGYTDACDIGLCLKRAVMLSAFLGNGTVQRRRFAALVGHAA